MNQMKINKRKFSPKNPINSVNFISKWSFWWLKDLFKLGLKRPIVADDIYELKCDLSSTELTTQLYEYWKIELNRKSPNLLRVLLKSYGSIIFCWGLTVSIVETSMRLLQPLCLGGLITYFSNDQSEMVSDTDGYLYATGVVLSIFLAFAIFHPFMVAIFEIAAKVRIGCSGLLYRKTIQLTKCSIYDGLNGKLINLLSNDIASIEYAISFFHDTWKSPIETGLIVYFIYREIGLSAFVGIAFLFCFVPLQAWFGKKAAQFRMRTAKRTDFRVKIMNEIITGIQIIKMYAWENSFTKMIDKIRKKEINAIRGTALIRASLVSFTMISRLSIFLTILSYVLFDGNLITARKVFVVSSFYNIIKTSMVVYWPLAITSVSEGYISIKRIQEFLLTIDQNQRSKLNENTIIKRHLEIYRKDILNDEIQITENQLKKNDQWLDQKSIELINATAIWKPTNDNDIIINSPGIFNINLKVNKNELCVIVGKIGCGKSTLLNVLLGELNVTEGSVNINGSISYASQEPWIFEGSIKNNILFSAEYNDKRYREVVQVCALETDFQMLPNGDETIIGERGMTVSGGQKSRINLARTIYRQSDIYLLDDPLSAVDSHIGKHIYTECMEKYLRNKICILITHQLQYLNNNVNHIVVLNDGRITDQGSYSELQINRRDIFTINNKETEHNSNLNEISLINKMDEQNSNEPQEFIDKINDEGQHEEINKIGAVNFSVYKSYFAAINNKCYLLFIFIIFVLAQLALSGVDIYLTLWVNWEENVNQPLNSSEITFVVNKNKVIKQFDEQAQQHEREQFILIYSVMIGLATFIFLYRNFAFFMMCLKISLNLHTQLFNGITRTQMYFFHCNSSGRILNRFSKDIGGIDMIIPQAIIDCFSFFLEFTAILIIISLANYWLLIPSIIIICILIAIRRIYIRTGRSTKRIESTSRSPVFSHINATLQGLSTIRSFNANAMVEEEFHQHQNNNTAAWYLYMITTRAFAFWLDMAGVIYLIFVTFSFFLLSKNKLGGGNVGLAITQCLNLLTISQWGIRQMGEVENQMTSVERVLEYSQLKSESISNVSKIKSLPDDWPKSGKIQFENINLKYSEENDDDNYVLKNVSFTINKNEKIGIVGRTGAGKSSIIQAIFRFANIINGNLIIDGLNVNTIELNELRKRISIIPQDSILFSGTLRFNLDPFNAKTDSELWNALEQVELKSYVINTMVNGLESLVSDGGLNFSMGQRQLICLARAILRNNKILILDEATANVDQETDKLIQKTIRKQFANCTILTIAHRLNTIMDNDRILVMDDGYVREFDHPYKLLQKVNGYFLALVKENNENNVFFDLWKIAEENYKNRVMSVYEYKSTKRIS